MNRLLLALLALPFVFFVHAAAALKYSTRVVRTKYGPLRGVLHQHPPVEAFLGVPYATPPLGALRYMPPVTPSTWRTPRLADALSPVCPQRPPAALARDRADALLQTPRGRLGHLERLAPLLANQSEDCLYLNIYVPRTGAAGEQDQVQGHKSEEGAGGGGLATVLFVHGESFEWNSGNPYDGGALASYGRVVVVTINYRLGVLGFLKTGSRGSAQGNFGLMDLIAGLHWLRENLPAFGGDPDAITVMGHGTGAALANYIAVSPVAKELLHRVVLLSGSGLSPWALQREPLAVKRKVAEQTGCHGDLVEDDLAPCLRGRPLEELLAVRLDPPRFLPGFAPFVDGAVIPAPAPAAAPALSDIGDKDRRAGGFEMADFPGRPLLFGLTTTESYLDLSAQDLEFGFNETRRDRILRTFVRNAYYFHLNEIFSTLKNEYTDWERPVQNPLNVRDAALEVLSDGHTVAPLIRVGYLHTVTGGKTYFMHFGHQSSDKEFPQRTGSVRGEDVPYALGLPLVPGEPSSAHNYTADDGAVSKRLIHYLSNFVRKGDPNDDSGHPDEETPFWDSYDTINQMYLELGKKTEVRSHYRGHKMSLWLNLIPQLHQPGVDELSMRHHHFQEEGAQYYDGSVRPQSLQRPAPTPPTTTTTAAPATAAPAAPAAPTAASPATECPPNATVGAALESRPPATNTNLLRKLASSHYQSYTTALTVTIAVGCFLLLLNVLIFAGIYHQRDRGHEKKKKRKDEAEVNSCSSSSGDAEAKQALAEAMAMGHAHHHHITASSSHSLVELPLQEFKSSPPAARRASNCPPGYCDPPEAPGAAEAASPSIPEPPPPPKQSHHPHPSAASILRQASCPQTPNAAKKRVQIQEISV